MPRLRGEAVVEVLAKGFEEHRQAITERHPAPPKVAKEIVYPPPRPAPFTRRLNESDKENQREAKMEKEPTPREGIEISPNSLKVATAHAKALALLP